MKTSRGGSSSSRQKKEERKKKTDQQQTKQQDQVAVVLVSRSGGRRKPRERGENKKEKKGAVLCLLCQHQSARQVLSIPFHNPQVSPVQSSPTRSVSVCPSIHPHLPFYSLQPSKERDFVPNSVSWQGRILSTQRSHKRSPEADWKTKQTESESQYYGQLTHPHSRYAVPSPLFRFLPVPVKKLQRTDKTGVRSLMVAYGGCVVWRQWVKDCRYSLRYLGAFFYCRDVCRASGRRITPRTTVVEEEKG